VVQNVELLMFKKKPEELVEHFVEKIKEKVKLGELDKVKNPAYYFPSGHDSADNLQEVDACQS
jgi:hypothetical protein